MSLTTVMLVSGLAGAAQPNSPVSTWIAWNARLEPVSGQLVSINADSVRLRDERGRTVDLRRADLVALMLEPHRGTEPPEVEPLSPGQNRAGIVWLVDGQRWRAEVLPDSPQGEVALLVGGVGRVDVALDVIASIILDGAATEATGSSDRVRLSNADVIEGTVLGIGSQVEIESDTDVRAPIESVASVQLVNPPLPPASMRLWMSDGSVFAAQALIGDDLSALRCEAVAPDPDGWRAFGQVRAVDAAFGRSLQGVEYAPHRLVPLGSLELLSSRPEGERRWAPPPHIRAPGLLGLSDIELSGPMLVEWQLPRRGQRVSGTAALVHPDSPWADCVVRIEQGVRVLWEQRLNAGTPSASFVVEIEASAPIGVRVLPGERGPVHDAVRIERGWVLLEPPGESG
ncbi:MAG: hypothetical protein DYG94_03770 [Leptolyngbya sp. PLA3]|nr:MAG: hypothetical protein EDM82_08770 [Cyanobacteria bacterium CYA]MCE7967847.1 hypothetical protein [Leptolyngbya sp. PL-A3]